MSYTVNKLSKLSGVSIKTLHHYDQIGLLKPSFVGDNQYRYYEEEQLLILQQILFYRELGLPLKEVKQIIQDKHFDKIKALKSHREHLLNEYERTQHMIETIDKTILHLKGEYQMKDNEFYYGFDSEKQKQHEKTLVEQGIISQEFLDECREKTDQWTEDQKQDFIKAIDSIMNGLVSAMLEGKSPDSEKTQELMQKHYDWLVKSWIPDQEKYLGLMDLYQTKEFKVFYDQFHPDLLDYLLKAMKVYAKSGRIVS